MDIRKIKEEEINVDEIMKKIRAKIKKKKEKGIYSESENKKIYESGLVSAEFYNQSEDDLEIFLEYLNKNWDPREDSPITSHRAIIGHIIVFIKKVIRKFLKLFWADHILLSSQAEFNLQLIKLLNASIINYRKLSNQIVEIRQENILQKQRLERLLTEVGKKYDLPEDGASKLVQEKNNIMDHNYFLFENIFRGKQEEIKREFEAYLPVFKGSDNVLDIGCGRGEFLELLQAEGVKAAGIDTNEDMIHLCKEKKLDVKQVDVMTYLSSVDDNSLGGIFASHVIEHFNSNLLVEFTKLCSAKLKKGAPVVFETPNPLSIVVSATNFYFDLSHVKPFHPEAVKFLLESSGFNDVRIKFLSPFPGEMKLQEIGHEKILENLPLEKLNSNIEKLNCLLFGYQDYAVIGKK